MTDRRPPQDVASNTESEPTEDGAADGKRSQTLPLGAVSGARAAGQAPAPNAPRNTFTQAEAVKKPRAESGPVQTAPRSVFKPGSAPPAPMDGDKTVKRPYPSAWGGTLWVGNAAPPPATDTDKTVRAPMPAATMLLGSAERPQAPAMAAEPKKAGPARSAPPPPPAASARPPGHSAAEPLRVPSNRPAPTPYQQRGPRSGTLLMGSSDDDSATNVASTAKAEPAPAAKRPATAAAEPAPAVKRPATAEPAPAAKRPATAADPASAAKRPATADQPASGNRAAAAPTTSQRPAATAQPTAARRAGPAKTEALTPVQKNSEPIRLALDARDERLEAPDSMRTEVPRSRAPMIAIGVIVAVAVVAIVLIFTHHSASTADGTQPPVDGVRSSAVPATDVPAAVQPTAPAAALPAQPATPAPAANTQAVAPTKAPPARVPAEPPRNETAATKQAAHSEPASEHAASKPAAKPKHEAALPPEESGEVQDAREALQGLEQAPVMKVKAKEKQADDDLADRALRDAINHPAAPAPPDAPVVKVKPEAAPEAPPAP